ncbi:hypothetical protein BJ944DRAFT_273972 [Cunninghamella echinulata]|nr:hypothetical protein BJ944DRAFT_273972 [Cunninghamella echinulata]
MASSIQALTISPKYTEAVPTPPLSASPIDLPPIPELLAYGRQLHLDDGPPSPASPKKDALPAYLEPTPQIYEVSASKIRPQLFHLLAPPLVSFSTRRATAPSIHLPTTIYSPLPRRSHSQSIDRSISSSPLYPSSPITTIHHKFTNNNNNNNNNNTKELYHSHNNNTTHHTHIQPHPHTNHNNKKRKYNHDSPTLSNYSSPFQGQDPCTSPTLAAACASAANLHISSSTDMGSTSPLMKSDDNEKKQVDQSMFLTKNAHIKRPRNAWIHFRCHYGQALKIHDPTLRAEEISKRASKRWSLLSENEKKPWHQLAEQEKQAHKEAFPEYRYCPKRSNSNNSNNNNNNHSNTSFSSSSTSSSVTSSPHLTHSPILSPPSNNNIYRLNRFNDLDTKLFKKAKKM